VAQLIAGRIRARRFPLGTKLPPERELADQLGTSRGVLREALRILETRGTVNVRYGVGTFVAEDWASGHLTMSVGLRLETPQLAVEEITVARRVIECAVVEVAARARDDLDVRELKGLLDSAGKAREAHDMKRFIELDVEFHEFLGCCTHNSILQQMQAELTRATSVVRDVATETHNATRAALRFHTEILDAIALSDGERAKAAMLMHLSDAGERLLGALGETASQ